jgi:hypothetical protein
LVTPTAKVAANFAGLAFRPVRDHARQASSADASGRRLTVAESRQAFVLADEAGRGFVIVPAVVVGQLIGDEVRV